ncbi:MAG TPA: tetratricopeptide repeat protein [Candidatus Omnitrophota bacterium]|nr:tetratricopeptide repeat protein [Candidatus Omnitrophota bacterium]HQL40848.1 tetratricopeptide repeat protein [Candidatus Omnitrophota bacterium]
MRKIFIAALLILGIGIVSPVTASAYNFGDYRSVTLTSKAWEALNAGDVEAVLAYTKKCIELYGEQAKKMQASLKDYVKGTNEEVFKNWALNDVSVCLFIQGEAYRKAKMMDEAKEAYQKVINDYKFGQCWDNGGWFWKPAEAAKERLDAIIKGINVDFGDMKSSTLTTKAWEAYNKNDLESVLLYTNKCIATYGEEAKKMQASLKDFPKGSNEEIFKNWALNDIATCLFIQGEAYRKAKMMDEAKEAYQKVINDYKFGQCWDNGGWFWKPAEAAKERLDAIIKGINVDFGDMKSSTLTTKAWEAYNKNDLESVLLYTNKCIATYGEEAKKMQASLSEYPWENNEKIFSYWALNDVGTCFFIQGDAYKKAGKAKEAEKAFGQLIKEYYFAQAWDPQGWFWKPSEAAEQRLEEMKENQ